MHSREVVQYAEVRPSWMPVFSSAPGMHAFPGTHAASDGSPRRLLHALRQVASMMVLTTKQLATGESMHSRD